MADTQTVPTYLTTDELAALIKYDARTIRNQMKDTVLLEGVHYIRPFGGRKILFIWEAIQRDIGNYPGVDNALECGTDTMTDAPASPRTPPAPAHPGTRSRVPSDVASIPMAAGGVCHV